MTVSNEGLKYRQKVFRSITHLFRWFKEHFRDPIPRATPVATPLLTPGLGTPNMQAIQRAAASMSNQVFDQLSQVRGPGSGPYPNSTPIGGYGSHGLQSTPNQRTPSQHTPRNITTPQEQQWGAPPPSMPPPRSSRAPPKSNGSAWSDVAHDWQKPSHRPVKAQPNTPSYNTPGASSQMSISPNSSPAFRGDQTPLEDEWHN